MDCLRTELTRAEKTIAFIERYCVVPEGKLIGQPMKLLPFQKRFITEVFDNPAGTKTGILSIARKNGKTGLIAGGTAGHSADVDTDRLQAFDTWYMLPSLFRGAQIQLSPYSEQPWSVIWQMEGLEISFFRTGSQRYIRESLVTTDFFFQLQLVSPRATQFDGRWVRPGDCAIYGTGDPVDSMAQPGTTTISR